MLSRSLDQIIRAAATLPDHVTVASRAYCQNPEATAALAGLRAALQAVDEALLGRGAQPPEMAESDELLRPH
jgi:hypothetical protein